MPGDFFLSSCAAQRDFLHIQQNLELNLQSDAPLPRMWSFHLMIFFPELFLFQLSFGCQRASFLTTLALNFPSIGSSFFFSVLSQNFVFHLRFFTFFPPCEFGPSYLPALRQTVSHGTPVVSNRCPFFHRQIFSCLLIPFLFHNSPHPVWRVEANSFT